ncbi:MAG TPA: type II toxin-antitoxin system RelE/ParE family toxin [Gammaproteobacteria bacterium]|nr:type II toxin-antitoxin system RelE/ParE family toxin [Gammaproteobacteria bacterium]
MLKELVFYETERGKAPFKKWLSKLKDRQGAMKIQTRLNRLMNSNAGDCKHLRQGLCELKVDYGPGYRVYFTELCAKPVVLLLLGGTKQTQAKDIEKAMQY